MIYYYVFPFMNIILALFFLLCVRRHRGLIILILCQVLIIFFDCQCGGRGVYTIVPFHKCNMACL